ncbi:hypothetical protein VPH35_083650 [Triticum aestivum]
MPAGARPVTPGPPFAAALPSPRSQITPPHTSPPPDGSGGHHRCGGRCCRWESLITSSHVHQISHRRIQVQTCPRRCHHLSGNFQGAPARLRASSALGAWTTRARL